MRTTAVGITLAAAAALTMVGVAAGSASATPLGHGGYVVGYGTTEAQAAANAEALVGGCQVIGTDHFAKIPSGYSDTLKILCTGDQ